MNKFSPTAAKAYEPLSKFTLVKADWSWKGMYQDLYDKVKKLITKDACMKFYNVLKPLYLEMDASGIGLGAGLFQVREGMNCGHEKVQDNVTLFRIVFASKSLTSMDCWYSNIEQETLGMDSKQFVITALHRKCI